MIRRIVAAALATAFLAAAVTAPARAEETLSDAEKKRLREELTKMRDNAARDTTTAISADPTGSTAGTARNP